MEAVVEGDGSAEAERRMEGEPCPAAGQLPTSTGELYEGSGAKVTHHGYTFQFHLLMLYATRALNAGRGEFRIATEMAHAEKFDDVIFCFSKGGGEGGGGRCFQFVQAKHTLNQKAKVIRASQLFDKSGGPFSLTKYFDSYRKMKRNPVLLGCGDEVQSLVICSNMGFQYGKTVGHFVFEEDILRRSGRDEILSNELLKFKEDFPGRRELVAFLKHSCVTLPKEFSDCVTKGKTFVLKSSKDGGQSSFLYDSYRKTLVREVLDSEMRAFRKDFVKGCGLSSSASHFRDEMWLRYLDHHEASEKQCEGEFREFLAGAVVALSGDVGDQFSVSEVSVKALSKPLFELLIENRETKKGVIDDKFSTLRKNIGMLLDFVLVRRERRLVFEPGFLKGEWLPENYVRFREGLKARVRNAGIDFDGLEGYSFEMVHVDAISASYCGDRLEQDVREFLERLTFALNQPGIVEMESMVKAEVAKFLNVSDASNAYGRFFKAMYSWAESKEARYLTESDVKRFFMERKKEMTGGIRFNLRHPVVDFVGRDKQLTEIHVVIQGKGDAGSRSHIPRAVVLSGLGGMGKSEIAREYAKKHYSSCYDNIIWIDSENRERLESSFKMLAFGRLGILKEDRNGDLKDIEVIVQETYDFFKDKKTLLVFDNVKAVEDLCKFFRRFYLGDDGVYVLVTARTRDWKGFPVMDLGNFSPEEAIEFVHLSLGQLSNWDDGEAQDLTKTVSNFPLALKQAVSYIEEMHRIHKTEGKCYRISEYSGLLATSSENLLKCPFRKELLNNYSETTYATMTVALNHMRRSESGRKAIPMLNIMSYLSPDSIEVDIIRTAYPRYTDKEVEMSFTLMQNLSILRVDGSRATIHRLIQSVNRIFLKNSGNEERVIGESMLLAEVMGVEHQMSVWESLSGHRRLVKTFCHMPDKIAEQLSKKLMSNVALEFLERANKLLSDHMGPDHYETLISRRGIGRIYYYGGKFEEAAKVQKHNVEDHRRVLGMDNPDTYQALYHYGVTIIKLGKLEEALSVFREIVDRGSVVIPEGNSLLIASKRYISHLLNSLGRQNEKSEVYNGELDDWAERIVNGSQKKEKKSKWTKDIHQQTKREECTNKVKVYCRLKMNKDGRVGQVDCDELQQAMQILAEKCIREGKYGKAYEHYKSCFERLRGDYSEDHSKVLCLRISMCYALIMMENYDAALDELRNIDWGNDKAWDSDYIFSHMFLIGQALWSKGEYEESIKCFIQSLKQGKGDEDCIEDVNVFILQKMDEMVQRKEFKVPIMILQCLHSTLQKNASAGHFMLQTLEHSQGFVIPMNLYGHKREALEVLSHIYKSFKCILGEKNIKTLFTKYTFGKYYCAFHSATALKKGTGYIREVHKSLCERLDEEDVAVLNLMRDVLDTLKINCVQVEFSQVIKETLKAAEKAGKLQPWYLKIMQMLKKYF